MVANQVYKWEVVLRQILKDRDAGVLGGKKYVITLKNGGLQIEFNDKFALPEDVKKVGMAAIEDIKSGKITKTH